ncbi:hypothetical protein [Bacillus sp. JCM 19034]|uniref:hypothetical protein n=1 Tax=Bacillus sp. JCM 19034 TaxID=1481928 RepID=UPI0007820331|nr:hypothetical protein [Bacillus sp. JCM 19034]
MRKLSYFMKKVGVIGLVLLLIYSSVLPIEIVIAEDGGGDFLIIEEEEDLMVDVEEGSSDEDVELHLI